jgi:hypothetical protein
MRTFLPFLIGFALPACGARTGLGGELVDAGSPSDSSADAPVDVTSDAPARRCPLTQPQPNSTCESRVTLSCLYVSPPSTGITVWNCFAGGWVNDTTCADETYSSCSDLGCTPGSQVYTECIVSGGAQCCTCGASTMLTQCGGC